MALIKCPKCGKEISDQAVACVKCGYPIAQTKKNPVAAAAPAATFQSMVAQVVDSKAPEKAAPMKTVPTEMPEMKAFPGMIISVLKKLCGLCGYGTLLAVGALVVSLLSGDPVETDFIIFTALGLAGALILAWLINAVQFLHIRKFLRKEGYELFIRNDTPQHTNALNAFRLQPSAMMAKYIKRLNPYVGNILLDTVKNLREKNRKQWLGYVPYFLVLAAANYLIPLLEEPLGLYYGYGLIFCHLATAGVMIFCARNKKPTLGLVVLAGAIFSPVIFAYYYSDMWYHILICAAAAFAGLAIGVRLPKKK